MAVVFEKRDFELVMVVVQVPFLLYEKTEVPNADDMRISLAHQGVYTWT